MLLDLPALHESIATCRNSIAKFERIINPHAHNTEHSLNGPLNPKPWFLFGYGLRQLDLNRIPLDLLKFHGSERWLINQGQTMVIINGGHGLMGGTLWELSKLMFFIKILIRNRSFGE